MRFSGQGKGEASARWQDSKEIQGSLRAKECLGSALEPERERVRGPFDSYLQPERGKTSVSSDISEGEGQGQETCILPSLLRDSAEEQRPV